MHDKNQQTKTQKTHLNWAMLLVISTAYIAAVTNIQGFKALLPFIQDDLMITRAEAGLYSTFYFLSAAVIAIFSGRITDALGSKKGLLLGLAVLGVLMVLHSVAPVYFVLLVLGLLSGFAFSLITPSGNKGVIQLASKDKRAMAMGITQAGGGIGGVLGAVALPFLGELFGWRQAVLFSGALALLMAAFIALAYRLPKTPDNTQVEATSRSFFQDVRCLLSNRMLLYVCIIGLTFGATISAVTTHLPLYLTRDIGTTETVAGLGLALFQMGGILGHPGWGYVNDHFLRRNRRAGLLILGFLIALVCIFIGLVGAILPVSAIVFIPFVLGFITLGIPALYFTTVGELVEEQMVGTATGLALIFIRTGNFVTPPIFGWVADLQESYHLSWLALGLFAFLLTLSFYWLTRKET